MHAGLERTIDAQQGSAKQRGGTQTSGTSGGHIRPQGQRPQEQRHCHVSTLPYRARRSFRCSNSKARRRWGACTCRLGSRKVRRLLLSHTAGSLRLRLHAGVAAAAGEGDVQRRQEVDRLARQATRGRGASRKGAAPEALETEQAGAHGAAQGGVLPGPDLCRILERVPDDLPPRLGLHAAGGCVGRVEWWV